MKNIILNKMNEIVEKKLKEFKTDFTLYDTQIINSDTANNYIWIVRNMGTWLLPIDNLKDCESSKTIYNFCLDENKHNFSEKTDYTTGITKRIYRPKRHTFYYIDIQAGILRQLKKDYTIQEILEYHEKQKRKRRAA